MIQKSSTLWAYTATSPALVLFSVQMETGRVTSTELDAPTQNYISGLIWQFLRMIPLSQRAGSIGNMVPRIIAVSSLTGAGQLSVSVVETVATVSITNTVDGELLLVQIPHSAGLPLFPKIIDPSPNEVFVYRKVLLGDAATGYYHVTVAARGEAQAAVDAIVVEKNDTFSTPGTVGTFALDVRGTVGLFIHSVTVMTYTRVETQAKLVVMIDNPQGPMKAHEAVRPSATLITGNGSQLATPTVVLTGADGEVPAANGIPHQLDPDASYERIRVAAVGLTQATENVVSDTAYNKAQSLVVQF